ncbi:hypothetical protein [Yersinia bercovieri]|uniref:hypothetical protein n=1 Tax=Yersinia bercovieri TaxID=634 RepID=UPI001CFE253E|nr:hypothetical protein [Yersinia bercovieri]MCB5304266.1 hypothetical protein [Yersinia bercovieri]
MNIINKHLFMGLLLLILSPAVMAAPEFVKDYTNCSIKLLDDDSVEVSFRANVVDDSSEKTEDSDDLYPLLSFYLYTEDGDALSSSYPAAISNLSINGNGVVSPLPTNEWVDSKTITGTAFYNVSFVVPSNVIYSLAAVRVGVTIGLVVKSTAKDDGHALLRVVDPKGVSFNPLGNQCKDFEPSSPPDALKIPPKFILKSAIWELKPIDLDTLLDSKARGLEVPLKHPEANRLCISYRGVGITSGHNYAINASSTNGLSADGQHFKLIEKSSNNVINYKIFLDGNGYQEDIVLPGQENWENWVELAPNRRHENEVCWTPEITAYSTKTTDKGSYSDTLNFTITPEA